MAKRVKSAAERAAQAERLRRRPSRGKIIVAARALATAHGYEQLRVGELVKRAAVSRETFYTHFADKRACLAEATSSRLGQVEELLRIAREEDEAWTRPLIAALDEQLNVHYGAEKGPRARIMSALLELVAEHGYRAVRLADLVKAARVSYPSFYRYFKSKKECFASACEWLVGELGRRLEEGGGRWGG